MLVAAVQMNCVLNDVAANLQKAERLIAGTKADWVVLPELFNTGYVVKSDEEMAECIADSPTIRWMQTVAQKQGILLSGCLMVKRADGVITDTAISVNANGIVAEYDKVHLWNGEEARFKNGNRLMQPFRYQDFQIGMQICYEIGFPELSRLMVLAGANVLMYTAAFGRARYQVWDIQSKARALENGAYVVACNRAGTDEEVVLGGRSRIVAPDGSVIVEASVLDDEVIEAELDIEKVIEARRTVPYLRDLNLNLVQSEWAKI